MQKPVTKPWQGHLDLEIPVPKSHARKIPIPKKQTTMEIDWIEDTLTEKPAFRLLRGKQAAFALECIFQAFPTSETIERNRGDMIAIISGRIADRQALSKDIPERQPERLLTSWSEIAPKWLTPRVGPDGDMTFTLSPGAREAMQIIESSRLDVRVSTESIMTNLMFTLEDTMSRISGDAGPRIELLKRRIAEMQKEIEDLNEKGITPLEKEELADVAGRLQIETSRILSQLRDLPDMIVSFRNESEELTYTDTRPKSQVMGDLILHHIDLQETPAYKSMVSMSHLYSQTRNRQRFDAALEVTLHATQDYMDIHNARAIGNFMASFTRATNTIIGEERRVFEQQLAYLQRQETDETRRERRAAAALNKAFVRVREETTEGPSSSIFKSAKLLVSGFSSPIPRIATLHFDVAMPEIRKTQSVVSPIDPTKMSDAMHRAKNAVALGKATRTDNIVERIKKILETRDEVSLREILIKHPPVQGLKDIIQYLKIAASILPARYEPGHVFDMTIRSTRGTGMRLLAPNPVFKRFGRPGAGLSEFIAATRITKGADSRAVILLLPDTDLSKIETYAQ